MPFQGTNGSADNSVLLSTFTMNCSVHPNHSRCGVRLGSHSVTLAELQCHIREAENLDWATQCQLEAWLCMDEPSTIEKVENTLSLKAETSLRLRKRHPTPRWEAIGLDECIHLNENCWGNLCWSRDLRDRVSASVLETAVPTVLLSEWFQNEMPNSCTRIEDLYYIHMQ